MRNGPRKREFLFVAVPLFVVFLLLLFIRPVSPFEWDEVLFLRALNNYDAAAGAPHMPGYPAFVFFAWIIHLVISDEILSTQLCSILFGVLLAASLWLLAREIEFTREQAAASVCVMLAIPSFLWFAPVGLSDVAGAALCVLTAWAVTRSIRSDSPLSSILVGLVAAVAIGVRSQSAYVAVILGIVFVVACIRNRRISQVAYAAVSFLMGSVIIWVPAVLLTGPVRWWRALVWQLDWVQSDRIHGLSMPHAKWSLLVDAWLISPFGTIQIAIAFWMAVAAGFISYWIQGKRRAALFCLGTGLLTLLISAWSLNLRHGPRYVLSSLPFFAMLAAGVINPGSKRSRFAGGMFLVVVAAAGVIWAAPILRLRTSEAAPVWQALTWIKETMPRESVEVVHSPKMAPHVDWILGRSGFTTRAAPKGEEPVAEEGKDLLAVQLPRKKTPPNTVFMHEWTSPRIKRMVPRDLYLRCAVARADSTD